MTTLPNVRPHCRLLALVAFWVLSAFPQLSAQNPKQLITDACENELRQRRLSPGLWGTSLFRAAFDGRFAIFKNISKHLDETRHHFEPVPPDTNMQRALERLVRKSAIFSQPTQGDIEQSHESEKAF